jgi:hypothetical protein
MTAWQDRPPVSRRQVRQSERDETVEPSSTPEHDSAADASSTGLARQGWEADARRAPSPEGSPTDESPTAASRGRRVQRAATDAQSDVPAPLPEPLAYITQGRPQAPSYDGASFRGLSLADDAEAATDPEQGSDEQAPAADQPVYRDRDYAPNSRRGAIRPVGPPVEPAVPAVAPQTPSAAAPEPASSAGSTPRSDLTLTRRQMRELGIGGFAPTPESPVPSAPVFDAAPDDTAHAVADPFTPVDEALPVVAVPQQRLRFRDRVRQPAVETELEQAAAAEQATTDQAAAAEVTVAEIVETDIVETPAESAANSLDAFASQFEVVSSPDTDHDSVVVAELEPHPEIETTFEDVLFPSGAPVETRNEPEAADVIPMTFDTFVSEQREAAVPVFTEPESAAPVFTEPASAAPVFAEPAASAVAPRDDVPHPIPSDYAYSPPVGHWSTQALIDDDEQVQVTTFGRDVAATSGAITTNALVLPSMPTAEDIMGPLSGTGEILITGSINLPSSLGSTGAHPARYDHSDVDALLEADDREDSDPGSAPVRAVRAISTNTASGDVINSMKPQKSSRLPMILIVSAAVMAVGVVVLLVAGVIFKIF